MASAAARFDHNASLLNPSAILQRKWRAALPPNQVLPPYEEVVLGSLGRLADRILIVGGESAQTFKILRAGRDAQAWLDGDLRGGLLRDVPSDCIWSLSDALEKALQTCKPVSTQIHRVRGGLVETYDVLAFAMASRWGAPLLAAHISESGERYNLIDTIFRATSEGILALAAIRNVHGAPVDFQIVALNDGAARLLGRPQAELTRARLSELAPIRHAPDALARFLSAFGGKHEPFEITTVLDGNEMCLNVGMAAIGELLSATLTDVTDLKRREASFRLLFQGNPMPMYLYDPETLKFVDVNEAAVAHYGYSRDQFLRMTLLDIRPQEEWDALRFSIGNSEWQPERIWRHRKSDGSEIEVMVYGRPVTFDSKSLALTAAVDITERRQAEARIAFLAHHDALTGLPNRTLFNERLDQALTGDRQYGGLAVLFLDLDDFKAVNDTLGHPVGDELLKAVAVRLHESLADDELVARLGGDEFAIIVPAVSGPDVVSAKAERILDLVMRPYRINDHDIVVGSSIGIALAPSDGHTSDVLLRNADMALYRSKEEGRGSFHFFEAEMDKRLQARRILECDLRKGLAQGEFELYYQPLINLAANETSGFEALIRWRHPERGLISPAEFIPIAESIGFIVPLGEWILRQACTEAVNWPAELKVAVNLSPAQFKSRKLVHAVVSALSHSRLAPDRLELEITESVLLGETEANLSTLHQLRELGVHISMDDFGTGYSSLSYLRAFPFDKIKIDQSFVRDLVERSDCAAIVRAVTGLGRSLGIAITAEGVETEAQLAQLRAEGCTEVQGYLISPPRPAGELGRFIPRQLGISAA